MRNIIVLVVIAFTLHSCIYYTYYPTGKQVSSQTMPANIQLYAEDGSKEYRVLGSVAIDVEGNADIAAKRLKERVSKIGADAVIHVKLTQMSSFTARTGISGVAVKYID